MGTRFRKTKKIAPGVKVNLTKNGIGVTVGGKVARTSISPKGDVRVSASVPGSGVSVSKKVGSLGSSQKQSQAKNLVLVPAEDSEGTVAPDGQQFAPIVCPNCNGDTFYEQDGCLVCEYCETRIVIVE